MGLSYTQSKHHSRGVPPNWINLKFKTQNLELSVFWLLTDVEF